MACRERTENDFKDPEDGVWEKTTRKVSYIIFEVYLENSRRLSFRSPVLPRLFSNCIE